MHDKQNTLNVSLVQTSLVWESPEENRNRIGEKIKKLQGKTDIILLPEMFATGFTMNVEPLAEEMNGTSMQWMAAQAKKHGAVITGSLIIKENDDYYNRLIWMRPDGTFQKYDKRHLFTLAKEEETFTPGTERIIIEHKGWKICPMICYDLRFPVWSRNTEDFDVLLYVANFPEKRRYAWRNLLKARSIENQCFVLGDNIVGKDGNGISYVGDSAIIDPYGKIIHEITAEEGIISHGLAASAISEIRENLPFLNDKDTFHIMRKNT